MHVGFSDNKPPEMYFGGKKVIDMIGGK